MADKIFRVEGLGKYFEQGRMQSHWLALSCASSFIHSGVIVYSQG